MKLFSLILATTLFSATVFASTKYPFVQNSKLVLVQNFKLDREAENYRLYHESVTYSKQLTDLKNSQQNFPLVAKSYHRAVPRYEATHLELVRQSDDSRKIILPKFYSGYTKPLNTISEDGEIYSLSGSELTTANKDLQAQEPGQKIKAVYSDSTCRVSANQQYVECRFPIQLQLKCAAQENCDL